MDVVKSCSLHGTDIDLTTGAVKRRVDDAEVVVSPDRLRSQAGRQQIVDILLIKALINECDQVLSSLKLDVTYGADLIDLTNDILVVRSNNLSAILPVDLKSIVLTRIV